MRIPRLREHGRPPLAAGTLLLAFLCAIAPGRTETLSVPAEAGALARALDVARTGDVLELAAGTHHGNIVIDKTLTLTGRPGSRLVGDGSGRTLTVDAPGVRVSNLTIGGSGLDLSREDSGIFLTRKAVGARIENNRLEDNLIGIYLKGAAKSLIRGNLVLGRRDLRVNERGNGVQIWNARGAVIEDNEIRFGRDGIFVTTSAENRFIGNRFADLRFAVHYMYTNRSTVAGNRSRGNTIGYAIMYSRAIRVLDNVSEGDRSRGLLLNYANGAEIAGNLIRGPSEKCVFIYNANKNVFRANRFERCEIGVHFTAGSERNRIWDNAFADNRTQVKYVGTRHIEWSHQGRGNYWSDNPAFDLDGDGAADLPYRPNGLVDQIVWRHPLAKLLLSSPAVQVLRWAQSGFPALRPGGVQDSHPRMTPPVDGKG